MDLPVKARHSKYQEPLLLILGENSLFILNEQGLNLHFIKNFAVLP